MAILVCTRTTVDDPGIELVIAALGARGQRIIRFDSDRFPVDMCMSAACPDPGQALVMRTARGSVSLAEISAVWLRHMDIGASMGAAVAPDYRAAVRGQAEAAVWDMLASVDEILVVDHPEALRAASGSVRQLQLAHRVGLEIPRTVVTNDPQEVQALMDACPGGVVCKLVHRASVAMRTDTGLRRIPTRAVTAADLADPERLRLCPMIFQERVPKALELRITVVGERLLCAALDASGSHLGHIDWREDPALASAFCAYDQLPAAVARSVLALADRLGLQFATVDVLVTPDGRHVFLELNSLSYFDFIEVATGLPISEAIADLLCGLVPPRATAARPGLSHRP